MKKLLSILLCLSFSTLAFSEGFKDVFLGKKLTLNNAACAGLSFAKDGVEVSMYGEQGQCSPDLTLRVRWLDGKTFILIEKDKVSTDTPPRTFLYRVKNVNGNKVVLTEIWTGWGDFKDSNSTYTVK